MRLMAPDGGEQPLDKYVRFKNDISQWYEEMRIGYHLTEDDIEQYGKYKLNIY